MPGCEGGGSGKADAEPSQRGNVTRKVVGGQDVDLGLVWDAVERGDASCSGADLRAGVQE